MKQLLLIAIVPLLLSNGYAIDVTGNGGCPEGTDLIVSVPMQIKTDSKTGKTTFVAGEGRPVSQCVKDGIKKDTKPKKKKKQKIPETTGPYTIQIFQYGSSSGMGQTYASKQECEAQRAHLSAANKGLDYTYTCVKQ